MQVPNEQSGEALVAEVTHLHRSFFGSDPPVEVVKRYVSANGLMRVGPDPLTDRVVAGHLDPEAVELALRGAASAILRKKIQTLFYLVEVRSAYYPYFFTSAKGPLKVVAGMLHAGLYTLRQYLKGKWLVLRYHLV